MINHHIDRKPPQCGRDVNKFGQRQKDLQMPSRRRDQTHDSLDDAAHQCPGLELTARDAFIGFSRHCLISPRFLFCLETSSASGV
jgi:hypothetical protein